MEKGFEVFFLSISVVLHATPIRKIRNQTNRPWCLFVFFGNFHPLMDHAQKSQVWRLFMNVFPCPYAPCIEYLPAFTIQLYKPNVAGPLCMNLRSPKLLNHHHPWPPSPISSPLHLGGFEKPSPKCDPCFVLFASLIPLAMTKRPSCKLVTWPIPIEKKKETPRISERLDPPRVGRVSMKLHDVLGCLGNNKIARPLSQYLGNNNKTWMEGWKNFMRW